MNISKNKPFWPLKSQQLSKIDLESKNILLWSEIMKNRYKNTEKEPQKDLQKSILNTKVEIIKF